MRKNRKFTIEEKQFVRENYKDLTRKELCEILKAQRYQIDWIIKRLGLTRTKDKYFSEEQDKFIEDNYKTKRLSEIARVLNKSFNGVRYRVMKLGLINEPQTISKATRKPKEEPKKTFVRPKAEYTNKGYLYLLDKYSPQ